VKLSNDSELVDEELIKSRLPKKIYIGFEKGISSSDLKDVMSYIHSYAEDNFSTKKNAFYKVKKIKDHSSLPDGHIFEIQEGGEKQSYLDGVLQKFEEKDDVILQTSEKQVFIQKNYDGVDSYSLTEETSQTVDNVTTDKTLIPLIKQGHVFMFVGIILFSLSIISLFLASFFKYILFNQTEQYINKKSTTIIPITRIIQRWQSNFEFQAISVQYNNKQNIWEFHKKHHNYIKDEEAQNWKEGEVKYTVDKINNLSKLKKKEKENSKKRKNIEKKKAEGNK
jgi:hypothetical protein